jgi:zinc transport system substrate-binding protein
VRFGLFIAFIAFAAVALCACSAPAPTTPATGKLSVVVSILPHAYFAQRIGGDWVDVDTLVRPGLSAETFEITPRQMERLQSARIYAGAGMPFEKALWARLAPSAAASATPLRLVELTSGLPLAAGGDPHAWLDPLFAKKQAQTLEAAMAEADPAHRDVYAANLQAFESDLDALDARIAKRLEPYRARSFYVFHPAYGYFAARYGLHQVGIEFEGKEPSAQHVTALIAAIKADRAKVLFVQPQFPAQSVRAIVEATGVKTEILDVLAPNYLDNLDAMATAIAKAFDTGSA